MKIAGPFFINDRILTREQLLSLAEEVVGSGHEETWRINLFRFIMDFFNEDLVLEQKTSGTTGVAKSITLSRDAMVRSAGMTLQYFGLKSGDSALLCLPVDYIAGKMMVVRALVGGLNLVAVEPSGRPAENLDRTIGFAAMVPMQLFESITYGDGLGHIRKLIIGGGEISALLRHEIRALKETAIYETFGMSETYTHFAVRRINGKNPWDFFRILKGTRLELDSRGCAVVEIRGITDGKIYTNDLIDLKDSRTFSWLGRIDNVINSGGIKIVPEVLEAKIRDILKTETELIVTGIPDTKLGEKVVIVFESQTDAEESKKDEWMSLFRKYLAKHEIPGAIFMIPQLPRNEAMKVIRQKVKACLDV